MAKKEAFLNNDDLGDSLAGVQMLVRKHEAFEKTMTAQGSRFEELERFAAELLANQHYNAAGIQKQIDEVLGRRDRVREAALHRRKKLEESRQLHIFLRNIHEVKTPSVFLRNNHHSRRSQFYTLLLLSGGRMD